MNKKNICVAVGLFIATIALAINYPTGVSLNCKYVSRVSQNSPCWHDKYCKAEEDPNTVRWEDLVEVENAKCPSGKAINGRKSATLYIKCYQLYNYYYSAISGYSQSCCPVVSSCDSPYIIADVIINYRQVEGRIFKECVSK